MEIETCYPIAFPLVLASDGNWCISDPPTLEIALPSAPAPEPAPGANSQHSHAGNGQRAVCGVQERRRYHVEWRGRDSDLFSDDETGETWLTVLFAYRHLPDEDKAIRKAKVAARRAAREAAKQQAIEADEYDTKETPKKYPSPPIENVDPNVETVIIAYVPVVAFIVETWIKKHFDRKTIALENAGQTALTKMRAGNRLNEKRLKTIKKKLRVLDKKEKTLEEERAKALGEVNIPILENMKAEGIEWAQVIARGKPSSRKLSEKQWHILQQTTAMLCDIRWKKAALERKRQLALPWLELPKKQRGGGATIAEELFADGLLNLVEIVPSLPSLGRKNEWDYEAPDHIAYYLTKVVKSAIYDYYRATRRFRGPPEKRVVRALKKRKTPEYRTTIHKVVRDDTSNSAEWLYDGDTRYMLQCDRSGIVASEEQEYMQWAIDHVCQDIKDRPLLWMKEEGIFTESEIGEVLELNIKQIRKRLRRMKEELEELFELYRRKCDKDKEGKKDQKDTKANEDEKDKAKKDKEKKKKEKCSKRVTKNPEKRKRGEEFMARWRIDKLAAPSAVPIPHFLLSMIEASQPQFRPTSELKADRA